MISMKQVAYECIYRSGTDGRCCISADRRFAFTGQAAALCCVKLRNGRRLENVTPNRKSDSVTPCGFTLKKILAKFHTDPI